MSIHALEVDQVRLDGGLARRECVRDHGHNVLPFRGRTGPIEVERHVHVGRANNNGAGNPVQRLGLHDRKSELDGRFYPAGVRPILRERDPVVPEGDTRRLHCRRDTLVDITWFKRVSNRSGLPVIDDEVGELRHILCFQIRSEFYSSDELTSQRYCVENVWGRKGIAIGIQFRKSKTSKQISIHREMPNSQIPRVHNRIVDVRNVAI